MELIKNNAKVAANIAVELEKMSAKLDDRGGSGRPVSKRNFKFTTFFIGN